MECPVLIKVFASASWVEILKAAHAQVLQQATKLIILYFLFETSHWLENNLSGKNHPFSTFEKFSKKLIFLTPL